MPRILTAGSEKARDSNESSLLPLFLRLSQDKRRGWVARNTTHSSMHSCPVSSFSGRSLLTPSSTVPFALCVPLSLSLFVVAPQHPPHLQHGYPPSSFRSRLAYLTGVLSPSSLHPTLPVLLPLILPPSLSPPHSPRPASRRPPPASFVLLFCRRTRLAGISLLLHGVPLCAPFLSVSLFLLYSFFLSLSMPRRATISAYKHRGFI